MRLFQRVRVIRTERKPVTWLARFRVWMTIAVGLALAALVLESGYRLTPLPAASFAVRVLDHLVVLLFGLDVLFDYLFAHSRLDLFRRRWLELILLAVVGLLVFGVPGRGLRVAVALIAVRQAAFILRAFTGSGRLSKVLERYRIQPVQSLALSFLILIAAGTILLTFPAATSDGRGAGLLDALFTATSATCVTGLIVRDTPVFFSRFGQFVILALIQLGALGIMTFSASLAVVFGRRLALGQRRSMSAVIEESPDIDLIRTLRYILLLTLLAETAGTVLLFARWLPEFGDPLRTLYFAAFHSVSAFCNAGFSLFSNSLETWVADPAVCVTVIGLVVAGGLGFTVVHELVNREALRRGPSWVLRRLTVHSRLVLWTSGALVVGGFLTFFFFEYDNALAHLSGGGKLLASLFQAVTPRTAGFNTVPFAGLKPVTLLAWSILMFIGASPGGTGGGIKTTTLAILLLSVRNRLLGREEVEVGRRTIPKDVVYHASSIAAVSAGIVVFFFSVLLLTQRAPFQDILFETLSAFGTVGLSTGLTAELNAVGKVAIIALMYIGRLGPLTMALAMRTRQNRLPLSYPDARIAVG